jgi:hypothetical protein
MTDELNPNGPPPDGRGLSVQRDAWGKLVLETRDGRRFVGVEPVRAFPITDPGSWVGFCDADGREVFALVSLDGLPAGSRAVVEEELALREFVPVIRRIVRVSGESTPSDWDVETDHGPTRFTLDNEEDVRRLGQFRVMITDSRKLRYQVPDSRALDSASRRLLERFL